MNSVVLIAFYCLVFSKDTQEEKGTQNYDNDYCETSLKVIIEPVDAQCDKCGNEDFDPTSPLSTEYRYLPEDTAPMLSTRNLSWKITRYPGEIDNHTTVESVNLAASEAFKLWSSAANLQFYHIGSGTPDIEIKFQLPKAHNRQCDRRFTTGTIGHYVAGSLNPGKIHFNEKYKWSTTRFDARNNSVNLVTAISHEVGHLLGFGHTIVPNSIMYPYFSNIFTAPIVLSRDDISAATNRYGVKTNSHPSMTVPFTSHTVVTSTSNTAIPHSSSKIMGTTTSSITVTSASTDHFVTTSSTICNKKQPRTFFEVEGIFYAVCSILYKFDNCRGDYDILSEADNISLNAPEHGHLGNRVASIQIAPNCWGKVCSIVFGNRICSDDLTETIPNLDNWFNNRIDTFFCSCDDFCSVPFPMTASGKNVCAVAYELWCVSAANVFSPGQVWFRNSSEYWRYRYFRSALINPNCTVNFCHTETITSRSCLTLNGGVNGQRDPELDWGFMENVTTVHCSCPS